MGDTSGHAPLGAHSGTSVQQSADDDAPASQASIGAAIDCACGATTAHRSSFTINCAGCNKLTQVACLLQLFKQADGMPTKNNYDWVRSLIMFLNLRYYCSVCNQSRDTTTSAGNIPGNSKPVITNFKFSHSNDQTINQEMRNDFADLARRFENLQHDLYTALLSKDLTDATLSTLGSVNSVSSKTMPPLA